MSVRPNVRSNIFAHLPSGTFRSLAPTKAKPGARVRSPSLQDREGRKISWRRAVRPSRASCRAARSSGEPPRAWYGVGFELVVDRQTALVQLPNFLRQHRVPALGWLYAGAPLRLVVPLVPPLPLRHLRRLPRKVVRPERYAHVLAVGREHARGILAEGHRVHDRHVLTHLRGEPEEAVELLVARPFGREVRPHLVQ